jgi:hypothetical protein
MLDDLLENARQQAERSDSSVRAAAFLRIARTESAVDISRARRTLLEGLGAVQKLPRAVREDFLDEARGVAAAVSPEMLADIPLTQHGGPRQRFASANIVQTMLTHGHVDAAFDYLMRHDDPASFPFPSVGGVLHRLDPNIPEGAARRMMLLHRAVDAWRQRPSGQPHHDHERGHFVRIFGHFWKEFPSEEALALARSIVDRAAEEPDAGTSAGYMDAVHFTSPRQNTLFQVLHVLRHLDPALAQSLIDSHYQLAVAARRYPNGLETMNLEAEAAADAGKPMAQLAKAAIFSRATREILTANADSLTRLVAEILSRPLKTQSRSIGKIPRPLPITTRLRNTGPPPAHSVESSMRPAGALGPAQPGCWSVFQTTIFASSQPSNLLPLWPAYRHRRLRK